MTIELDGLVHGRSAVEATVEPRVPTRRRYLMCPPRHFTVAYSINPWMDPSQPVSTELAMAQWTALKALYRDQHLIQGTVDANEAFTNQLIDEINRFDQPAVIRQAKEYR